MSGSGNMIPQSRTMMRPSTSMQAQLRPISPRPPRKTTRTGFRLLSAALSQAAATVTAGGPTAARIFCACVSSSGGDAPIGSRHWPDAQARGPGRQALAGSGLGNSSVDSKSKESSSSALPAMAAARSPAGRRRPSRRSWGPIQWAATLTTPTAPTASRGRVRRRRRCRPRSRRAPRDQVGRAGRVAGGVLHRRRCWRPPGQPEHGRRGDAPPAADRDVVEHDRQVAAASATARKCSKMPAWEGRL